MKTPLEKHIEMVENTINLRDWKKKITDRLKVSYNTNNLTENTVLDLTMEFLQDYHDTIHCGHLTSDNRLPTDIDIQDMADIALAILVEYEVISIFGSVEQKKRECFEQLKKLYENG